jgi:hypothetical protein
MESILIIVTVKAPNHKMQLTAGILLVKMGYRHLEVGSDFEGDRRPARRSLFWALVRQAKLGVSCRVKDPVGKGLAV